MLVIIPVNAITLDFIEELNDGVRPDLEEKDTFFIYRGKDEHAEILSGSDTENMIGKDLVGTTAMIANQD